MSTAVPINSEPLHEQRDWLRVTLSSIGDAVITTDRNGRVTFVNPVAESLTGWTIAEAVGQPLDTVFQIIDEDSRIAVESPTVVAFRERRPIELVKNCLLVSRDGTETPIDDSAAPISNDAGFVSGVVLVFRDITARRVADRAFQVAAAYADDIIATLREPFVVLDGDLRVKTANQSFYDTFHVSKEETEHRFVYELGNGQWDIPGLRTLLDEVLTQSRSIHDIEVEHSFPELGRKTMLLNARPFPPGSKQPDLILLAIEDVTVLRERADEVAEASRNKDEFLATLAHELRNPLAPIRNAIQYLGMSGLTAEDASSARDVIARQVTVMVRLIDDLLDVSRISTNRLDIRKERIDLSSVIANSVESSRPLIERGGHRLTIDLPPEPILLDADPVRLSQVFMNLLNNAAKYTKHGGEIWLSAKLSGSDAVIVVRDNGIGIEANMLGSVFDMFTQVDRALDRSQGGLGIGLTLVRRVVEMHDGTIEAFSKGIDQGCEFVVTIPVLIEPLGEPEIPKSLKRNGAFSETRVLIVDDNADSANSLGMLLRLKGSEIRIAHDGLEAVGVADSFKPELVLLDIGLPKLNGYEVARHIRQQAWGRSAIIVALTGWGKDEDRRRSHEAGFNFHLVKPVEFSDLEQLLSDAMANE